MQVESLTMNFFEKLKNTDNCRDQLLTCTLNLWSNRNFFRLVNARLADEFTIPSQKNHPNGYNSTCLIVQGKKVFRKNKERWIITRTCIKCYFTYPQNPQNIS